MATTDITLGSGELYINNNLVGYLSGAVTVTVDVTLKEFFAGVPKRKIVQIPDGTTFNIKAGIAEITATNLAAAQGQQSATTLTGGSATVSSHEPHTFRSDPTYGLQFIQLGPGPGMATTFSSVVIKDPTNTTTYVANTDYTLDAATGLVTRISAGAIPSLGIVHCDYTYLGIAGTRVDIGFAQGLTDCLLHFVHTKPQDLKKIHVVMWKAQSDGKFNLPFGDDFLVNDVTWSALEDTTKTQNSLGYIFEES